MGWEAMVRKRFLNVFVVVLSLGLIFAGGSLAGPRFPDEIEAAGSGEIVEGNEVKGRENAILDGISKALVAYLSQGLGKQTMREYASRIKHNIIPGAEDLVENFSVLSEDGTEERFSVLLNVKFNKALVEALLRESGVPLEGDGTTPAYRSQAMDSRGAGLLSVVFEGDKALVDSLSLERYLAENVPGVASVRTARLGKSRVAFEVAFRGDRAALARKLATGWAPFRVESAFDGDATITLRQWGYHRPRAAPGHASEKNTQSDLDNPDRRW
jgi:hypothetical protein